MRREVCRSELSLHAVGSGVIIEECEQPNAQGGATVYRLNRLVLILFVAAALAQERPAFEVVSLKHLGDVESNMIRSGNSAHSDYRPFRFTGGSVSAKQPLMRILTEAYQVKEFQIHGPGWLDQEVYEVGARMPEGTPVATARQMLQTMLEDRMGLKLRREQKEYSVFALMPIPGSAKLEEVTPRPASFSYRVGMDYLEATPGMPISALLFNLSRAAGKPVLDETGLKGFYKVNLHWNAEPVRPAEGAVIHVGTDPALLSALSQIGLKVEPVKRTMDSLVIEKVSKEPTEN
jgi:uncharacterized protein (TIGR03435 family)